MTIMTKRSIGTTLKLLAAGSVLMTSTALKAQDAVPGDTERDRGRLEGTGIVAGLLTGAAAGGPPGAIVGAVAGALMGNHISDQKTKRQLRLALADNRREMVALREARDDLEARYQEARAQARDNDREQSASGTAVTACCADAALTLHFRTNSAELEPHYRERLKAFARLAGEIPEAAIHVTGHADRRGAASDNLSLSRQRVEAVQQTLRGYGVRNAMIEATAHGDSRPVSAGESLEGHFFDRRVHIELRSRRHDLLTGAPNDR